MTTPSLLPVTRPDGSSTVVSLHPAASGSPDTAPLLVLVPAMGMRAGYYAPFAAGLARAGCHVAVTELRGHEAGGGRPPGRRVDFGYAELAADLGAAVDVVRTALPAAPLVLVGHSMGGHVASVLLATRPHAASALVLVASGTTHWRAWGPWQLVRTQVALLLALAVGHFPGQRVGFAGREARGVLRDWARLARTGRLGSGRPPVDHAPALAALDLPVLAVTVAADDLGPVRSVRALLRWFPRAHVESVHVVPAAGEPPLDHFRWARRPELVVPAVRSWLVHYVVDDPATSDLF